MSGIVPSVRPAVHCANVPIQSYLMAPVFFSITPIACNLSSVFVLIVVPSVLGAEVIVISPVPIKEFPLIVFNDASVVSMVSPHDAVAPSVVKYLPDCPV